MSQAVANEHTALLAALGAGQPLSQAGPVASPPGSSVQNSYRQRQATQWRGVTATTGTNSGEGDRDWRRCGCKHAHGY